MRNAHPAPIGSHTVGNALVLHARDKISSEAQSLALTVAEDYENDIVVLDLHDDLPIGIWESVAAALPRRRRGIRLVVCGAGQDTSVLAGQWISDRLGRSVVAPHGQLIRGTSGALFVHSTDGSGWVRYHRGRSPRWEAKRYPQPVWDSAATDVLPTSAHGLVEPLPGGVWIRDTRDEAALREHWQWLASAVPCQPEACTVVLGCPGTPPLALDDIARFWRDLADEGREHARFIQYGPVQLPDGEPLGQALADLLETPVICFTGVPVGRPEQPRMHTVALDGRLGWQVYARELGYTPRPRPTVAAAAPSIISYQAPEVLGDEIAPLTFRYADDAVVEILQSGLWVRPPEAPRHADRIRARPADPAVHAVVIDDAQPARMTRLRELADDLVARLDVATRERSTLQLASTVVVTSRISAPAGGTVPDGLTFRFTAADLMLDRMPTEEPAATPPLNPTVVDLTIDVPRALTATSPGLAGGTLAGGASTDVGRRNGAYSKKPPADPPLWEQASVPVPRLPTRPSTSSKIVARIGESAVGETRTLEPGTAARVLAALRHADSPDPAASPSATSASSATSADPLAPAASPAAVAGLPGREEIAALLRRAEAMGATSPSATSPSATSPSATSPSATSPSATSPSATLPGAGGPRHRAPGAPRPLRFQEVAEPEASGVPDSASLGEERTWLRDALRREYDLAAGSVSRILSEYPGFQAGPDTMTDAVAVRLYLSAVGDGVDEALRDGGAGAEVPFARCVAGGLVRLPSHRGATMLVADLSADDLRLLRDRRVLRERGFTHALIDPPTGLHGEVDVLIWSMTARRTRLLEPEDEHRTESRVVFLPGTSFKVLDAVEPGPDTRGLLLLRELSADEPVDGRVPFDDLALGALHRAIEQARTSGRVSPVGELSAERFLAVPGVY
ncbi:hypothetical protein [Actinoplanes sp. NPDC051494]|uniref:hypothetical protein n=1 Tax=Actinoplanes sp. NPDC051494 TaxID=3363907 RepID=UPI00379FA946